jgi:integrase
MASVRKHGNKWQARIQRRDQPSISKSFHTKADALKWARNVEAQADLGVLAPKQTMPRLKVMVARYVEEVTPTKKGWLQERGRATLISRSKLAEAFIDRIDGAAVARYRDQRLAQVSNNTVRLELAFLSVVFEQCRREWGLSVANPVRQIRMPKPGKPRQRRLEFGEEDALLRACRASGAHYLETFVILAIETGMRFGELAGICREHVNLKSRTIHLPDTKSGHHRIVPLTTRATAALQALPTPIAGRVFDVQPGSIRSAFLSAVAKAKAAGGGGLLGGLRFHDLRHEAVSRLFEKGLNPIEVGMISGHRTMAMLQRYAHLSPASLVAKLG